MVLIITLVDYLELDEYKFCTSGYLEIAARERKDRGVSGIHGVLQCQEV